MTNKRYFITTTLAIVGLIMLVTLFAESGRTATAAGDMETFICQPVEAAVLVLPDRIHVRCAEPLHIAGGGAGKDIYYFAAPASIPAAPSYVTLITAAMAAKSTLSIWASPTDESGVRFGCLAKDCRAIQGLFLLQQ
jgi:hypothetical protein